MLKVPRKLNQAHGVLLLFPVGSWSGFGTQGQETSSSYLYKSAVINSGGSQKHSCLRIWMLGTPDFNGFFMIFLLLARGGTRR